MNPWYREPWPWILMSGPAAVIVAGAITTWMAFATADGLVADDYYKRGLAINAVLGREQAAARLGIAAQFERSGDRVRVRLAGAAPDALFLQFAHATRAGHDLRLRLSPAGGGLYEAALPPLATGHWRLILEDPRGEWRVVKEGL
ncbi:MAG: FixH family protein [Gammaproteobacteria bacterium]|nr:FixH family protein [Gammaproteobacteria bacterium]